MSAEPIPAIPSTAFVPCPKVAFKNVRVAANCPGCEFFKGMLQVDRPVPFVFVQAMRVGCAHPVTRTMIHVEA